MDECALRFDIVFSVKQQLVNNVGCGGQSWYHGNSVLALTSHLHRR